MLSLIDFGLSNEKAYPKIFSVWAQVKEIDATVSPFEQQMWILCTKDKINPESDKSIRVCRCDIEAREWNLELIKARCKHIKAN